MLAKVISSLQNWLLFHASHSRPNHHSFSHTLVYRPIYCCNFSNPSIL